MEPQIIPATAEHLTRFFGKPPERSMRALVGVLGDEVLGVVALIPSGHRLELHASIKPEARKYRKTIVRGAHEIMRIAAQIGAPVHAEADPDIPCAVRFLERLGFIRIHPEVFEWHGLR